MFDCDFIFVCVPTPMSKNGDQDLSFIKDVFSKAKTGPIYIIKSTVTPGTTRDLIKEFNELKIIFSPEFLTERTSKLDMLTQARIILGGNKKYTNEVKSLFIQRFMNRTIIETDTVTAELVKYMNNTFFATKVSIINEFKLLSDKIGANWQDAMYGFSSDHRIGDSHLHVPGPDGKLVMEELVFQKDVNALLKFAEKNKITLNTIMWLITNLHVRPEKDWEKDKGRAVSQMANFDLKGLRILVTGGAGFIGSNLCQKLLELGANVICFDNLSTGFKKY